MVYHYALTITPRNTSRVSTSTFDKSLNRYEKAKGCVIFPRYYETAPKTGKTHLHGFVKSQYPMTEFLGQKNHNIKFVPISNMQGWLNYCQKDQPKKTVNLFKQSPPKESRERLERLKEPATAELPDSDETTIDTCSYLLTDEPLCWHPEFDI